MTIRTIKLDYGTVFDGDSDGKSRIDNISGAASGAGHLWTATDEGFAFERLVPKGRDFGDAVSFHLSQFFEGYPPGDDDKESDIESLAYQKMNGGGRLWLVGSQGLVRKNYKKQSIDKILVKRPKLEPARSLLGFVEISADGTPRRNSGVMLPLRDEPGSLVACLTEWEELARAAKRPSKENGLDVEGLAVVGNRVFLGLRGPVFGPYAVILELVVAINGRSMEIVPVNDQLCRPYLIDTGGLGIRDLALHPRGLIALAGPTLDMEGPFELYLASMPLDPEVRTAEFLMEIPIERLPDDQGRRRGDRPEGIAVIDGRLLVIAERKLPIPRQKQFVEAILLDI